MMESYVQRPRVGQVVKLRDGTSGRVVQSRTCTDAVRDMLEPDAAELVLHARARYGERWQSTLYILVVAIGAKHKQVETIDVMSVESD